jgi:hypothetical protein
MPNPKFESEKRAARVLNVQTRNLFQWQTVLICWREDYVITKSDALASKVNWENKRLTVPEEPIFLLLMHRPLPRARRVGRGRNGTL